MKEMQTRFKEFSAEAEKKKTKTKQPTPSQPTPLRSKIVQVKS